MDERVSDKKFAERLVRQANDGHGWNKVPDMLREAAKRIRELDKERASSTSTAEHGK